MHTDTRTLLHVAEVPRMDLPRNRTNHCQNQSCSIVCALTLISCSCLPYDALNSSISFQALNRYLTLKLIWPGNSPSPSRCRCWAAVLQFVRSFTLENESFTVGFKNRKASTTKLIQKGKTNPELSEWGTNVKNSNANKGSHFDSCNSPYDCSSDDVSNCLAAIITWCVDQEKKSDHPQHQHLCRRHEFTHEKKF